MSGLKREKTKLYDTVRHALQAPIRLKSEARIAGASGGSKYRVLWLKEGKERRSPWFYHLDHAEKVLAGMRAKFGERNATIYWD